MNIQLAKDLQKLVNQNHIQKAIELIEKKLSSGPHSIFSMILGKNMLDQSSSLETYLDGFYKKIRPKHIQSIYAEMNGFYINFDLWFVDFFGIETIGSQEDLDWLSDWKDENASNTPFVIRQFKRIQHMYASYQSESRETPSLQNAFECCDYLIILRLFELFQHTFNQSTQASWMLLPFLISAHDFELVYRINPADG